MAHGIQIDRERFSCPLCLSLFIEPVSLPCGHCYCMHCANKHLDHEEDSGIYSCPECRQEFVSRPLLVRNNVLAFVVDELRKALVAPTTELENSICSKHYEVMKLFCRTDQSCICYLCSKDEHKGHEKVSAAAERNEKQKDLQGKDMEAFQQEEDSINDSVENAMAHTEKVFADLSCASESINRFDPSPLDVLLLLMVLCMASCNWKRKRKKKKPVLLTD
uniref:Uncharacterized protein n=1 Tax=Oryzias melastigma TaxID=30732 RepID=A0A3B3CH91_ORYME